MLVEIWGRRWRVCYLSSPLPGGFQRLLNSSFFLLQSICGALLLVRFWCARSLATDRGTFRSRSGSGVEFCFSSFS